MALTCCVLASAPRKPAKFAMVQHRLGPAGGDKAGRDHLLLEVALQQADAQGEGHLKRQVACERSQQKPIIIVIYIYTYIFRCMMMYVLTVLL